MSYKYDPPRGTSVQTSRADILAEFRRWNAQAGGEVISDYDLPMMRPGQRDAEVVFFLRGRRVPVHMTKWEDFSTNLRCCYLVIRDMRLGEARGMQDAIREAYAALPAPVAKRSPYEVLNIRPDAPMEVAEASYRALAKLLHPDTIQGDNEAMVELNAAIEQLREGQTALGAPK